MQKKITYYKDIGNGYINLILTTFVFLFILFILFIVNFFMSVISMICAQKDNFFIFSFLLLIVFLLRAIVEKKFYDLGNLPPILF